MLLNLIKLAKIPTTMIMLQYEPMGSFLTSSMTQARQVGHSFPRSKACTNKRPDPSKSHYSLWEYQIRQHKCWYIGMLRYTNPGMKYLSSSNYIDPCHSLNLVFWPLIDPVIFLVFPQNNSLIEKVTRECSFTYFMRDNFLCTAPSKPTR